MNAEQWVKKARELLGGKKIVDIRYLYDEEMEGMGWDSPGIVFFMEDGTNVIVSQDDEGNGPGALFVDKGDTHDILPVLYGESIPVPDDNRDGNVTDETAWESCDYLTTGHEDDEGKIVCVKGFINRSVTWNGWAIVLFEKDEILKYEKLHENDTFKVKYVKKTDCIVINDDGDKSEVKGENHVIEGRGRHLYAVGSGWFIWHDASECKDFKPEDVVIV